MTDHTELIAELTEQANLRHGEDTNHCAACAGRCGAWEGELVNPDLVAELALVAASALSSLQLDLEASNRMHEDCRVMLNRVIEERDAVVQNANEPLANSSTDALTNEFVFEMRAVDRSNDSYYVTRWDRATPLEVVAETKQKAINKADTMLGDAPRGRYWVFRVDKVRSLAAADRTQEGREQ